MRLLIVEDEKELCDTISKSLYESGYEAEQQRRARVVEVRDDLVLHARHALPLRVVRIRHHRRPQYSTKKRQG